MQWCWKLNYIFVFVVLSFFCIFLISVILTLYPDYHTLAPVLEEDHFSDTKRAGWKGQMMMTWCKLLQSSHHFHRMAWSINRDALAVPYPAQTWRAEDISVFSSSVEYKHIRSFEIQVFIFSRPILFIFIDIYSLKRHDFFICQKHNIIWSIYYKLPYIRRLGLQVVRRAISQLLKQVSVLKQESNYIQKYFWFQIKIILS